MKTYEIITDAGTRYWRADDIEHALEQHLDAFSQEEKIISIKEVEDQK